MRPRLAVTVALLLATGGLSFAQAPRRPATRPAERPNERSAPPAASETPHIPEKPSITTGIFKTAEGANFQYTATAGYMPLTDEQGKLRANIFYTAYTPAPVDAAASLPATHPATQSAAKPRPERPITFLFNGGPGAASVWLHLGAVGPKRLEVPADGSPPSPPYHLVDNPDSWLPTTDLVFVDPVNTGYSRAAQPQEAKQFFGVREDIQAMGEFIRLYLTQHQRWGAPIFLAGESYGTTRAAGLVGYLQENVGVQVQGIILMSTVLNFATLQPREGNDLAYELYLPSYAAVAWYHKKLGRQWSDLPTLLKEVQRFTVNDYTVALTKGTALSDADKRAIAKKMSDLIGLPEDYILQANLRVPPDRFEKELLRGTGGNVGKVIGRFDGRLSGDPVDATGDGQQYDPSLSQFLPAYTSAFNMYVRGTLKFDSNLPYEVLSGRTQPWDWGTSGMSGYLYVGDNLRDAMIQNPHLKVLVCQGRFDLATPYFATVYTLDHLTLTPDIRKNITLTYYPTGHMIYHVRQGRDLLSKNVQSFITQLAVPSTER